MDAEPVRLKRSAILGNPYAKYQKAKHILANTSAAPEQIDDAVIWLPQAAEAGLDYAQYTLGRLYLLGKDVPQDHEAAVYWRTLAARQGNPYAQYFLDHAESLTSLFSCATRLLHTHGKFFSGVGPAVIRRGLVCGQQTAAEDPGEEDRYGSQA